MMRSTPFRYRAPRSVAEVTSIENLNMHHVAVQVKTIRYDEGNVDTSFHIGFVSSTLTMVAWVPFNHAT